jgi:hypothetical protein
MYLCHHGFLFFDVQNLKLIWNHPYLLAMRKPSHLDSVMVELDSDEERKRKGEGEDSEEDPGFGDNLNDWSMKKPKEKKDDPDDLSFEEEAKKNYPKEIPESKPAGEEESKEGEKVSSDVGEEKKGVEGESSKKDDESKSEEKKDPPKFSFGGGSEKAKEPPKFSFGSKSEDKKDEKDEPAKPAGGFFANLGGSKPASSGFSFGSSSSGTSSAAFTFAPTATGSSAASSSTAPSTKEDEEYVPPVAETKEFDDAKDALYQKKSKIFYLKDGNYKEIGVGLLFVKPLENDKASILVRADNTLGNILLNVAIPPSPAPVKQGKNNCLLPVVPNPPIEGVEGAVPLLIRVKTSDDADELIEIIKSKQS